VRRSPFLHQTNDIHGRLYIIIFTMMWAIDRYAYLFFWKWVSVVLVYALAGSLVFMLYEADCVRRSPFLHQTKSGN
jgi:hypothetical protein